MRNLTDKDIVVSTRVRLARNIAGLPFPKDMSRQNMMMLCDRVEKRVGGNGDFVRINMDDLDKVERTVLVERHLASRELIERPAGVLLLSKDDKISIMLGEEDHVRLQCVLPGLQLGEADSLSCAVDAIISALGYAYDPQLGYLTSCPTNVGTGMRASVMMHLPGLVLTGSMASLLDTVGKFGFTLRGYYGEGTNADGDMYQISNQVTLGVSEEEILASLSQVVCSIIEKEREVREALLKGDNGELADRLHRSLGVLKYARRMNTKEMMQRLSDVKLGISLGMFEGPSCSEIDKLITRAQPASISAAMSGKNKTFDRDEVRAKLVRVAMKDCIVY